MAIYNTPDGRQVVGSVESGNDYHGFNGKRDIIIQLTADGATADGLNALEYLKAYAVEQNKQGNPIFPNGTRVWISANGYTKAVEADDIVIDGENVTIGGIAWNGSAWDYSKAGQGETGLPAVTPSDAGKVLAVQSVTTKGAVIVPEQTPNDDDELTGDPTLFVEGATVIVTVNGTEHQCTVANLAGKLYVDVYGDDSLLVLHMPGAGTVFIIDKGDETIVTTISVNLAANSGVWKASELPTNRSSDTLINISVQYSNGAYVCNNTFDVDEFNRKYVSGADVRMTLSDGVYTIQLYPTLLTVSDSFIYYEAFDTIRYTYLAVTFISAGVSVSVGVAPLNTVLSTDFIVTLTPTAANYSGTMDKTVAEIDAAYKAGRKIVFRVYASATQYADIECVNIAADTSYDYPSYNAAYYNMANNALIVVSTGITSDGTKATYGTHIYTLTPAT